MMADDEGLKSIIIFKVILLINNCWKCVTCLPETKTVAFQYCDENQQERIENLLFHTLGIFLKQQISDLMQIAVAISYTEINIELIPVLFTQRWAEPQENVMEQIIDSISEYYQVFKLKLVNPIHLNQFQKISLQHLVNLYFEQLIWTMKNAFPNCCASWNPQFLPIAALPAENEQESNKKKNKK